MRISIISAALFPLVLAASARAEDKPLKPKTLEPPPEGRARFIADPLLDGGILSISGGFALLLNQIISTEELTPQQPGPTDRLLSIDRGVVHQEPSATARTISNVGLYSSVAYAVGDSVYTGVADGAEAGWVDLIMYAETAAVTGAVTNLAKLAVRRPRPSAYRERDEIVAQGGTAPEVTSTNSALSFFSGHASMTAALSSTATYLAFVRSGPTRGYLTLAGGTAVTTVVCWGRVRGGVHFPTDVIAGAMAGIGIGVIVPHLHREAQLKQRPVWVGVLPTEGGGGLTLNGLF
ncbi:MAG: phosphatase PAP2 family protein [Myxococcales bacterium]|nr:phosphatase PAP2 family protein [Myxococcales bacterium]MCB9577625.1 phosphatase PAP2 family protein [Polyangiaceae bacterium]